MDQHWRQLSACKDADLDLFFPERGGSSKPAKKICETCPVRVECLNFVLATEQPSERFGVFGGLSGYDRKRLFDGKQVKGPSKKCFSGRHVYTAENTEWRNGRRYCIECRDSVPDEVEHGHPYVLMRDSAGHKRCRTCFLKSRRDRQAAYRAEKRGSAA